MNKASNMYSRLSFLGSWLCAKNAVKMQQRSTVICSQFTMMTKVTWSWRQPVGEFKLCHEGRVDHQVAYPNNSRGYDSWDTISFHNVTSRNNRQHVRNGKLGNRNRASCRRKYHVVEFVVETVHPVERSVLVKGLVDKIIKETFQHQNANDTLNLFPQSKSSLGCVDHPKIMCDGNPESDVDEICNHCLSIELRTSLFRLQSCYIILAEALQEKSAGQVEDTENDPMNQGMDDNGHDASSVFVFKKRIERFKYKKLNYSNKQ